MSFMGKYPRISFPISAHIGDNTATVFQAADGCSDAFGGRVAQIELSGNNRSQDFHIGTWEQISFVPDRQGNQLLQGNRFVCQPVP